MIFNKFQRQAAHKKLDELFDKDERVNMEVVKEKRTLSQNRLYWLWVACIRDNTGNDKDIIHEAFLEMFAPKKEINVMGINKNVPVRTSEMNTKQFTDYLDNIQVYAATEESITLPDPNDKHFAEFEDYYKDKI